MAFVLAHMGAICSIAYILLNEFLAHNPKIQANSIGQLLTQAAKNWLAPRASQVQVDQPGK